MRYIGSSSTRLLLELLLVYCSVFVSSFLLLPLLCLLLHLLLLLLLLLHLILLLFLSSASLSGFHGGCTSTSFWATSLRFHSVPFHAVVCCQTRIRSSSIVPGATLLGAIITWAVFKIPLLFHYTGWVKGIPLLD